MKLKDEVVITGINSLHYQFTQETETGGPCLIILGDHTEAGPRGEYVSCYRMKRYGQSLRLSNSPHAFYNLPTNSPWLLLSSLPYTINIIFSSSLSFLILFSCFVSLFPLLSPAFLTSIITFPLDPDHFPTISTLVSSIVNSSRHFAIVDGLSSLQVRRSPSRSQKVLP
jgi:hypothetical protein